MTPDFIEPTPEEKAELKEYCDTIVEDGQIMRARKRFFELARELGYKEESVKANAVKHFGNTGTFDSLTVEQLWKLICKMEIAKVSKNYNQ